MRPHTFKPDPREKQEMFCCALEYEDGQQCRYRENTFIHQDALPQSGMEIYLTNMLPIEMAEAELAKRLTVVFPEPGSDATAYIEMLPINMGTLREADRILTEVLTEPEPECNGTLVHDPFNPCPVHDR